MTIRRLTHNDAEEVVSLLTQHSKFQNLPKSIIISSIHDKDTSGVPLIDRFMAEAIPIDLKNPDCYWFGNFSNTGVLLGYQKFKLWYDPDFKENVWSRHLMCKNPEIKHTYSYGQYRVPDCIIDIANYAVEIIEDMGMKIGYDLVPNAVSAGHRFAYIPIHESITSEKLYRLTNSRYSRQTVEEIPAGQLSTIEKFRQHISTVRFSVAQKIVMMTKI